MQNRLGQMGMIAAAAICAGASMARADMTEVQKIVQTAHGKPTQHGTKTTYIHGNHVRIDQGAVAMIIDGDRHTITYLNVPGKYYIVSSYAPTNGQAGAVQATVTSTGKRSSMLGHPVHLYNVSVTTTSFGVTSSAKGTIWAADDYPHPDLSGLGLPALNGFGQAGKLKGLPMSTSLSTNDGSVLQTSVVSLTSSPIPPSRFRIPAGCKDMTNAMRGQAGMTTPH